MTAIIIISNLHTSNCSVNLFHIVFHINLCVLKLYRPYSLQQTEISFDSYLASQTWNKIFLNTCLNFELIFSLHKHYIFMKIVNESPSVCLCVYLWHLCCMPVPRRAEDILSKQQFSCFSLLHNSFHIRSLSLFVYIVF